MAKETKADQAEREQACERLRAMLKPGDTVYTSLKHVNKSGMSREISLHAVQGGEIVWLSGLAARAMGERLGKRDGIVIRGCGMDMGFHLVYNLARTIYRETGFACTGKVDWPGRCPSNDHSNRHGAPKGTGKGNPWIHSDPGYALRHSWI